MKLSVARYLMNGFLENVNTLIESVQPDSIHEVGCGEGHLSRILCRHGVPIRASDFSTQIIDIARSLEPIEDCQIDWIPEACLVPYTQLVLSAPQPLLGIT